MSAEYPVSVEVASPVRFDRIQVLVRLLLAIGLGWLGVTAGWLVCLLFAALPVAAAIVISSSSRTHYLRDAGPGLWRALDWLLQLAAYMALLVDRFPAGDAPRARTAIRFTGTPRVGSALARLVTSIPSGLVLIGLWCVAGVLWVVAAATVLVARTVPDAVLAFQRGVLRWQARLVAYHASLVAEYPPFRFDTAGPGDAPVSPGRAARTAAAGR